MINTYSGNIKEKQANHPIGTLNTFIVILLYYICLYVYLDELHPDESPNMVHFSVVYVVVDFALILISFVSIGKVKARSQELIENERFKEYN